MFAGNIKGRLYQMTSNLNPAEELVIRTAESDLGLKFTGTTTSEGYIMEDTDGKREPYTYKALIQSIKAQN
jgi:hypothetical protein